MVHLPALVLPKEFLALLKEPNSAQKSSQIISVLRSNPALSMVLEKAFAEFDEHQIGLEKISTTLGWDHFRDRMCSVYIFKILHSVFPDKTDMDLVEEIKIFEKRFSDKTLAGNSRLFILGFYLKTLNLFESYQGTDVSLTQVSTGVDKIFNLSKARTDKPDWLVLIIWHLVEFLGEYAIGQLVQKGTGWKDIFQTLKEEQKFQLVSNLLSYGASIHEDDPFLYERI
jgi:hypothetical protein